MSRLHLTFACGDSQLAATVDSASGSTGLLLVSGGNEVRSGAFGGQAALAADIAGAGYPVFRFDRRGVGDSEGENRGFRKSGKDIAAALATFRAISPQVTRVVGFGNCDAASALMLAGGAGCDALVLSNPWTYDEEGEETLPPAAIRSRYSEKLRNTKELVRLLSGGVNLRKLVAGMRRALRAPAPPSTLAEEMRAGLADFYGPARFLVAGADRTGMAFENTWGDDPRLSRCDHATHAYVEAESRKWLQEELLSVLRV